MPNNMNVNELAKVLKTMRDFNIEDALNNLTRNRSIWWSWGVEKITKLKHGKSVRGMSFQVNGMKFQGVVVVTVNGLDYYEVRFLKEDGSFELFGDIFCDNLVQVIDEYVEKQPNYAF
jgi:hypothetical protein